MDSLVYVDHRAMDPQAVVWPFETNDCSHPKSAFVPEERLLFSYEPLVIPTAVSDILEMVSISVLFSFILSHC